MLAGPDGTGKSSTVTFLKASFPEIPVWYLWSRPGLLPRRSPEGTGDASRPHAVVPYGRLVTLGKLVYVFLDFQLGWLFKIRPFLRRPGLLVIERSWWDLAVDPRRYRLRPWSRAIQMVGRLVPRPDLVLLFEGTPQVIVDRKPELSTQEVARQIGVWRSVLPAGVERRAIDVDRPFDAVSAEVKEVVEALLASKGTAR